MTQPEVGNGVTQVVGSDRYPFRITQVAPSGKRFWMKPAEEIEVKSVGGFGCEGKGGRIIEAAPEIEVRLTGGKRPGWKIVKGGYVYLHPKGEAPRYYQDPSY